MTSRTALALNRFKSRLRDAAPETLALKVRDLEPWVVELRRLAAPEAGVVFPVALECLQRLRQACEACERTPERAVDLARQLADVVSTTLRTAALDRPLAFRLVFRTWIEDATGLADDLASAMLEGARSSADLDLLTGLVRGHLDALPLVLPPGEGSADEVRRTLLIAERHRVARLLGEVLAAAGSFTCAVLVAKENWRRTDDVLDLLRAMRRAGMEAEALAVAERALDNPRTLRRSEVIAQLHELVAAEPVVQRRDRRRARERGFLAHPNPTTFAALKASVVSDHWPRVRLRVLTQLLRLRDESTLAFRLWCAEGEFGAADGVAQMHAVGAAALLECAAVAEAHGQHVCAAAWQTRALQH